MAFGKRDDILYRTTQAGEVLSQLAPNALFQDDRKRPDETTIIPVNKKDKCLFCDANCINTLSTFHVKSTVSIAGASSEGAELKKHNDYVCLSERYIFTPSAIGNCEKLKPRSWYFCERVERRLEVSTLKQKGSQFSCAKGSVQWGNAVYFSHSRPSVMRLLNIY